MITRKSSVLAMVIAVASLADTSHAGLVLGPTTVSWPAGGSGPALAVTYSVDLTGSTYSYYYVITPPADFLIDSFTVDVAQQATLGNISSTAPNGLGLGDYTGYSLVPGQSVTWNFNNLSSTATNSFTSQYSPVVFGIGSAAGVVGSWMSPGPDIPVPVPEASSILAGIMMIFPLSVGALRVLRKARGA